MFCLNLTSYAGNVMPGVLRRIAELEAEIRQMRDRYTALADEAGNMWRQRAALAAALLEADNPNITAWVEKTVTVPEPYDSGDPAHHRWCSYRCDPSRVAACDCDAESAAQRADIEARAAAPERNWT
jgi:hypothetical protein